MLRKYLFVLLIGAAALSCDTTTKEGHTEVGIDEIAREYVKLGLLIGQYDGDFVDAYYGPDSLKPAKHDSSSFPKEALLAKVSQLKHTLSQLPDARQNTEVRGRAEWLTAQLTAFERRIHVFSYTFVPFDSESKQLFDAVAPVYDEQHF